MSLKIEGQSCPVCHAYLFSEDDVVFCPECGAPHHRECYKSLGHCGLIQYHGTDEQYDRKKAVKEAETTNSIPVPSEAPPITKETVQCPNCHAEYESASPRCPECGLPNFGRGNIFMIDMLGGVPKDFDIGDGVSAQQAKNFVAASTNRIIPKFAAFKNGRKLSWNWGAFLLPSAYFAFRKMYKNAFLAFMVQFASSFLMSPFTEVVNRFVTSDMRSYSEVFDAISLNVDKIPVPVFILAGIGILLGIAIRIICALTADKSYYRRVISKVKDIEENSDDKAEDYRRYGGVNLLTFMLFFFAAQYIIPILYTAFF